jgi:hypothetical protein
MSNAPRLRLKVPNGSLPLPPGGYEIGRSAHCQVILDGAKVSRLHARLVVGAEDATIEDLGSANGVFVNGRRVMRGRQPVVPGDRILIGDVELELSIGDAAETVPPASFPSGRPTLVDSMPAPGSIRTAATTKAHALELLGAVARRAFGTGDAARAELILKDRLAEVLTAAATGRCDAESRRLALDLALSLARTLPSARWIDYAVDLLVATEALPTDPELSQLEAAARVASGADARKLQDYTSRVRAMPSSLEKVRSLQRLEGVLQVVCGRS